ncbi:hypothetical protein BS78_03G220100 [Paspalum vaginatum]|nr:hypothetical protein BS78_03G220100 [Paspalum vaginatum]
MTFLSATLCCLTGISVPPPTSQPTGHGLFPRLSLSRRVSSDLARTRQQYPLFLKKKERSSRQEFLITTAISYERAAALAGRLDPPERAVLYWIREPRPRRTARPPRAPGG